MIILYDITLADILFKIFVLCKYFLDFEKTLDDNLH